MTTHTKIHTTKKLEKLAKKLITTAQDQESSRLGKWNANVFFVDRKKCWIISNAKTQYSVILTNIKASDFKKIEVLFKNAFYNQLIYDGISIDFETLAHSIGELHFLPTDNDRKTTGFQNQRIMDFDYWKHEFGTLENMPILDLANRINRIPIHIGVSRKMEDFTYSIDEMKALLS